jgi:FAD/FMN-containing dehydrogenase
MVRKYGLAVDNMLSVRMVTADAEVVTASKTENPDLFWAVRGGGGNFGIITEFEFQLAPVGAVLGREIFLPATREILRSYLDYALNAPDELTTIAHLLHAPPFPFMPEDRVGELMLSISVCYTGDLGEGERVVAPLRALAEPIVDTITAIPYPLVFEFMEPATHPHFAEVKMSFANELSDEALDGMIAAAGAATSPFSMVQMRPLGGAMARVPAGDTAFAHRDKNYFLAALSLWMEPSEEEPAHRQWARDLWQSWQPFANGAYVNFLGDEGEARVRDAYPQGTHDRLTAVKNRWDPENRFHNNQNVRPRR